MFNSASATFKVSDSNGLVNFDPHFWGQRNLTTTSSLFIRRVMRRIWYKQRRNYGNNNPCHLIYHQSNNGFWRDSLRCIFSWISKWYPTPEKLSNFALVSKVLQSFAMDCRGAGEGVGWGWGGGCSNLEKFTKPYFALPSGGWCFGQCKIFQRYTFTQFCLALLISLLLLHNSTMYSCICTGLEPCRGAVSWRTTDLLEFFRWPCQPRLGELHLRPPDGSYQVPGY